MSDTGSGSGGSDSFVDTTSGWTGGADNFTDSSAVSTGGIDRFTETTTQGYGSRLVGSIVAAMIGVVLVPVAAALLYWNEGRAVDAIRALDRGAAMVIEADASAVKPVDNGRLVHLSGMLRADISAKDPQFGVTGDNLVRLSRDARMYQWEEERSQQTRESVGGTKTTQTTYNYKLAWSDTPVDSSHFRVQDGHRNPPMPFRTATFDGSRVTIGAWRVDPPVLDRLGQFAPLPVQTPPPGYQQSGDGFYLGHDPEQPVLGDVRVSFRAIPAQTVSVAAAASNGVLTTWRDANGFTIGLIEPGSVSAAALFHDEKQSQNVMTWVLRGAGFVVMLIGLVCLTRPLTTLFAVLPFLESLVGAGAFLVSLTLAIPLTLAVIAIAWIAHRPVIGATLLAAALVVLVLLPRLRPKRTARIA